MHLFLAVDGSDCARAAEEMLSQFPFGDAPQLTVATVCPAADLHSIGADVTSPITEMLDRCREDAARLLAETVDRCQSWASQVDSLMLDGHPADELLRAAEHLQPDLVVVGSRGLGPVRRFLLGSVSERIAKHTHCSVLVTRRREQPLQVKSIVVAYDGSPASVAALDRLAQLPLTANCRIHLISVVETVHVYGSELVLDGTGEADAERQTALARLEEAAVRWKDSAAQVDLGVTSSPDVAGAILDAAEKRHADLIVVGSRGKSAWERFLLGSATLRILHQAPCSIWVERPRSRPA
ncbi:MAG: universal stress protein [Planctomycetaceae bacterium]